MGVGQPHAALEEEVLSALEARSTPVAGPLARALGDARALCERGDGPAAAELLTAAALAALAAGSGLTPRAATVLARSAAARTGADPLRIALLAVTDPTLQRCPFEVVVRAHATLLAGLAGVPAVAVWRVGSGARPAFLAGVGRDPEPATRRAVAGVLSGLTPDAPALTIRGFDEPCAMLAWGPPSPGAPAPIGLLAPRSAEALGLAFERAAALESGGDPGLAARAAERRMSRVALDLHDGPVQDIALLRGELARLHAKLDPAGSGCLEDLMSVAEAAEADLREMAVSLESTSLGRRPLVEALNGAARAFALRSGIEPELTISGDASGLTSMERVAVMRVVGEALANVREHSGARTVAVRVAIGEREVTAAIRDDGRGFDLDHALPDAARRGRLGLLGMIERMRLLDGVCAITSEPGAGTTVALRFERFFDAARETGEAPATVRSA